LWILTIVFAAALLLIAIILTIFYANETFRAKIYRNNFLQFLFDPVDECGDNEYDVFISYSHEGKIKLEESQQNLVVGSNHFNVQINVTVAIGDPASQCTVGYSFPERSG
jgi:hypothetical protein